MRFLARSKRGIRSMPAWRRWNKTEKKMVLRIRLRRDQGRSRRLTVHSNRWKTGYGFAIGLISSPPWEQDTERKRRPSNDRVAGNKTEKKTVLSTPQGTRLRSAALQTIESAAELEIGPTVPVSAGLAIFFSQKPSEARSVFRSHGSIWSGKPLGDLP